jgi:cyclophilin family peptidyl-prolyl cis-trans isomerase
MSSIFRASYFSKKRGRSTGSKMTNTRGTAALGRQSLRARSLRIEPLESRHLLSVATTVAIGAPVLAAFDDPMGKATTVYTPQSSSPDVTATLLHTSEMLKMTVHVVDASNTTVVSGEMDFLLLDDYTPANIANITSIASKGLYNGTTFQQTDPLGTGDGSGKTDDEFSTDVRFTSSGLLALANRGPDSNGAQFFITSGALRDDDFQYTIIGKLVHGDDIRQQIANIPLQHDAKGNVLNPHIIDSVSVVKNTNTEYGLVLLKAASTATAGETANVTIGTNDGSSVTLIDSSGSSVSPLNVALPDGTPNDKPSDADRPAFIQENMPDVYTDANSSVAVPIPITEGDAGVPVAYNAMPATFQGPELKFAPAGSDPTNASVTVTTSGNLSGVYSILVGVWRNDLNDPSGNVTFDSQVVALYVRPIAPTSLSVAPMAGNNPIYGTNHPTFQVTGATAGMTVAVFADGNSTPIGTAVASGDSVIVPTTTTLADGLHTFTVEQGVSYTQTTVGNRTIPAGTLYSKASASTLSFTVDTTPPTLTINLARGQSDPSNSATITFAAVFDEAVTDFVAGDVTISSTAGDATATVTPIGTDGKTYTVAVSGMTHDGTVTIDVPAGKVHDLAGNLNVAAIDTHNSVVYDTTSPTLTVSLADGQKDPTSASPINFKVVFSEAVTDFVAGDVTISGAAGGTTAIVTPVGSDGTTYNVAVSGMSHDGTVTMDVATGKIHDRAGNVNLAPTNADNSVTYNLPTTVAIGAPVLVAFDDPTATAATTFTANSTEPADVTATFVPGTGEVLKMKVHTVNADGTTGVSGEMDFLLLGDYAPINIAHITALANSSFYDTTATKTMTFHRIIQDFMIQGGDPTGTGRGGSGTGIEDDEFNTDVRFTSSGLLALANRGNDTNDCQFFITSNTYRDGDYQYTILGKLVAGDDIRQAIAAVPVNGSAPLNPPIIDSVTVVPNTKYGLVMLKAGTTATAGETADVTISTNDGSSVTLTDSDGSSVSTLHVALPDGMPNDTPSDADRPAFIQQNMPDVYTDANTAVTVPIPAAEGDAGVPLAYVASVPSYTGSNLQIATSGDGPSNGSLTVTPSGNLAGVYSMSVGVKRNDPSDQFANSDEDSQDVALFIRPAAPALLSVAPMAGNYPFYATNHPTFHVTGVTAGMTVAVFADGNSAPIGTAVAAGDSVDVLTATALADGLHTFTVEQSVHYSATAVGNRTIPAGDLYSEASASTLTFTVDTTPPTLTINQASGQADPTKTSPINFKVVFSEAVTDFVVGDVTITSTAGDAIATVTPVGSDGTTYTVAVTGMSHNGKVTINVATGKIHDQAGNVNLAPTIVDNSVSYDITPPTVQVIQPASQPDPTNAAPINFTVVFDELVTGFVTGDVLITGNAGATTATVTPVGSDGTTYNVAVTGMTQSGTVSISVPAGVAQDQIGNLNVASTSSDNTVTYDITAPTVTINQAAGQADPSNASTIYFTAVFSEPVVGFGPAGVLITGTAGATTATVTPVGTDGTTYNVAVTGLKNDGTIVVALGPGAAKDKAGNPSNGSTSTDHSVSVDTTRPTVTVDMVNYERPTSAATINFAVVFSEPVTSFTSADVTIGYTRPETLTAIVTGSGATYNVAVSGMMGDGIVTASIAGGAVQDAAGNVNYGSGSTIINGFADNVIEYLVAPTVGSIVVAEAGTVKNGILETNEPLRITWVATSRYSVKSQTMTVDGRAIAPINGPYSGIYYSCPIGTMDAGSHTYTILSTDSRGVQSSQSGTFSVTSTGGTNIAKVVVAEAAAPKNGILESNDSLKITWAGWSSAGGFAWQSVTVDGRAIAPINGPYAGQYYSCSIGTWAVGNHSYVIQATDGTGYKCQSSGTFTVASPAPPTISNVAVAEAAWTNGILEPSDAIKITWAASGARGIASQTVSVDGKAVKPINGPYGGIYYSCPIGTWASGSHTYIIHTIDATGADSYKTGTFSVAAALTVGALAAPRGPAAVISDSQLAPIATAAIQRLESQLGSQVETAMAGVQIKVANLAPGVLGEALGKTIWIDDNAAGYGWFVDPTPGDDVEFADSLAGHDLTARPGTAADEHADLLTTVMHEMGHLLGYAHAADDLMQAVLPLGVRRTLVD